MSEPTIFFTCRPEGPCQLLRGTPESAGMDIVAAEDACIRAQDYAAISTGLKVIIPKGYVGLVKSRSGNAFKLGIEVGAGVIDSDYRGEVKVLLHNMSNDPVHIHHGERIAQLIVIPCLMQQPFLLHEAAYQAQADSENFTRGAKGFGSTGGNIENGK